MKFSCVSCGAPRGQSDSKFDPCEYCGGLPEVSLSHDRGLLSSAIKSQLRARLEAEDDAGLDLPSETSLIILYLLDDLTVLAEPRVANLLTLHPNNPSVVLLSAVVDLCGRGIAKTKIGAIDDVVSKLNLVLALDSGDHLSDVAFLVERIGADFYKRNGIKPSTKFKALSANLAGAANLEVAAIAEIFPVH